MLLIGLSLSYATYLFIICNFLNRNSINTDANLLNRNISIIVAFRNEVNNLPHLFESFSKLNYPIDKFEVILVNDHSSDNSYEIAKSLQKQYGLNNIKIISLSNDFQGKKNAINLGIANSKYEVIATTDADCMVNEMWLRSIAQSIATDKNRFISMPVILESNGSFIQNFQQIDFLMLNSIGGASMLAGLPIMSNAANMAFYKSDYIQFHSSQIGSDSESGDDMFLMFYIKKLYHSKNSCMFVNSANAIVVTKPQINFSELISQRIRWSKKAKYYKDLNTIIVGGLLGAFHFLITLYSLVILFNSSLILGLLIVLLFKLIVEIIFYHTINKLYHLKVNYIDFILSSIFYSYFTSYIMVLSIFSSFNWKGRVIKN